MVDTTDIRGEFTSKDHVLEIISAVLLALATLASSWSAYQATRWSGLQALNFSKAGTLRVESTKKTIVASRKLSIQVALFSQFIAAVSDNDTAQATFLRERFPPELLTAAEAWLATEPLKNPDAPSSPFTMPEYRVAELQEADSLTEAASEEFEAAKDANQRGDNYVLLTVLFASVLFFSGVAPKFRAFALRVAMLSLGGVVFLAAALILIQFPVH